LPLAPLEDTSSAFRFKLLLPATGAKKLLWSIAKRFQQVHRD
jgi:hypothetical protein